MKQFYLSLIILSFKLQSQVPTFAWVAGAGGTSNDYGWAVTHDALGNVYTTGYFQGTSDFDPGPGTFTMTSAGNEDVFIAKYNSSGNLVWVKQMGGTSTDVALAITVDNSGNVFTTGYFWATADFDPGPSTYTLLSAGSSDMFVSKLDASGNFVWAKQISGSLNNYGYGIKTDAAGNIYTTGYLLATTDFDPGPGTQNVTTLGGYDVFVCKFDALGNFVWVKQIGGPANEEPRGFSLDVSGNIYVTGNMQGTTDFDPGIGTYTLSSYGIGDVFVFKLDPNGNFVWAAQFGSNNDDWGQSIVADNSGNVFINGWFRGVCDFDPGPLSYNLTPTPINTSDAFIAKLDVNGNFVWAKQIGGTAFDYCQGIDIDASSNVYSCGYFQGTADFDPSPGTFALTPIGSDAFVNKLDAAGNFLWAAQMSGSGWESATSICVDLTGNIYTTGIFDGTPDFDPSPGTYTISSAGTKDIFTCKFGQSPLGLEDLVRQGDFIIYPNPTAGDIYIDLKEKNEIITIEIINLLGQVIDIETFKDTSKVHMNINQPAGVYFISIKLAQENVTIKLVRE